MRLTGIAASPGIALGPIYRLEHEELAVRDTPVAAGRVEEEIERFHVALEASRHDLKRIHDGIAAELGDQEARIYEAHLLILDDPELRRTVEEGIRRERRNASWVFRGHMSGVAARLEQIDDDYLRERRADVADVERRVLRHLLGEAPGVFPRLVEPSIIVAHDLMPSDVATLQRDRVLAFVTEVGGRTSHSAIVARGRGIPAVTNVRGVMQQVKTGDRGAVDGFAGHCDVNPDQETTARYRARRVRVAQEQRALAAICHLPAVTLDGRRIELGANIELPSEAEQVLAAGADSVGLFRTEFFYLNRMELPSEEEQYRAYREVTERLAPRPVLFRTMDLGGDKVASYLGTTHETNPFLGWRGIRFALQHPEVFRQQLRAIFRASAHGRVRMMFPMISSLEELTRTNQLCLEVAEELRRGDVPHDPGLEIGIMIETPSAVWVAEDLARHARFFSVGTNDLIQYTLAMDRDNVRLASFYEPLDPAVIRSLHHTIEAAHAAGRWVGVCGEMAGDPRTAVLLIGLGVDELSTSPYDLPRVKAAIRGVRQSAMAAVAEQARKLSTAAEIKALMSAEVDPMLPRYLPARRGRG